MRDRETIFINELKKSGATYGIGDDCVLVDDIVVASDSFLENVHFKIEWGSVEDIIEKAFLVNLSDIYAMNAVPKYAVLNISIPQNFYNIKKLARIIGKVALQHNIKIIGGDTTKDSKLNISITIIANKKQKILYRNNIKIGDYVGYIEPISSLVYAKSQRFGRNIISLKMALRYNYINKNSRFIKPILYPKMISDMNRIAGSGMDISDGIFMDLARLSKINKIGFNFLKRRHGWFYSPEEYQMLYSFKSQDIKKAKNIAKKYRHKLVIFAKAKLGIYRNKRKNWHS